MKITRTVDYKDWKKRRRSFFLTAVKVENLFPRPCPGNRPRDPEKERLLIRLEAARRQRYIESGKLQILGPRKWRWRIDFKSPS